MAKTKTEKVVSAFKTLLARAEQVRVNNTEVTSATANCLGKWSINMKLKGGKELALDDKALEVISYDKGDFIVPAEDGKKENKIAFYTMKKEVPRHI